MELSRIQTLFMRCWLEIQLFSEDGVYVLGPKAWSLWVTLHVPQDRNYIPIRYRWSLEASSPPIVESSIRADVVVLFWAFGLRERVACVGTNDVIVTERSCCIEDTSCILVDA